MTAPPYEWPTASTGPGICRSALVTYAVSMAMPRSGLETAWTFTPAARSCRTTSFHPELSANAPCTRATVGALVSVMEAASCGAVSGCGPVSTGRRGVGRRRCRHCGDAGRGRASSDVGWSLAPHRTMRYRSTPADTEISAAGAPVAAATVAGEPDGRRCGRTTGARPTARCRPRPSSVDRSAFAASTFRSAQTGGALSGSAVSIVHSSSPGTTTEYCFRAWQRRYSGSLEGGAMTGPRRSRLRARNGLPRSVDAMTQPSAAEAGSHEQTPVTRRVGWSFVLLYTLAFLSTSLLFLAPLLVTLALKVNSLVGTERAPNSLSLVAGTGALLTIVGNPFFGRMSDRTASRWGMRRPWMVAGLLGGSVGILVVALAPAIPVVLVGWCIAQLLFNAVLAAMVAVLPDQVPEAQRGMMAGVLGVCTPIASVLATFLVKLFTGNLLAMFLAPCVIGGFFILLFAVVLDDRRLAAADRSSWSLREFAATFYVDPRKSADFAWAFASRFLFVLAYAFPPP